MKTSKLALALAVAGALSAGGVAGYQLTRPAPAATPVETAAAPERALRALPDFTALVERNGAAVVNVRVIQLQAGLPQGAMALRGQGSGFIVSPDGIILTNAHVIDGANAVNVQLADRREFRAKVLGADARSDVFSLSLVLFEAASGHRAFAGASYYEVATAILHAEPDWARAASAGVDPGLAAVLARGLAK